MWCTGTGAVCQACAVCRDKRVVHQEITPFPFVPLRLKRARCAPGDCRSPGPRGTNPASPLPSECKGMQLSPALIKSGCIEPSVRMVTTGNPQSKRRKAVSCRRSPKRLPPPQGLPCATGAPCAEGNSLIFGDSPLLRLLSINAQSYPTGAESRLSCNYLRLYLSGR